MNKNLNLMDILKDCPKGYKLYSTIYGEVKFEEIINDKNYPIVFKYSDIACEFHVGSVTNDGRHKVNNSGECTLFPEKHQRDWAKFKVEPEMIDGEFYYCNYKGRKYIFIYKKKEDLYKTNNYAIIKVNDLPFILKQNAPIYCGYLAYFDELRNATEDEKQLLLNVIKREGYKWDEENKKLVKIESDMVDGEIYCTKIDNYGEWIYIYKKNDTFETNHYVALLNGYFIEYNGVLTTHNENIKELRKATEEEKQQLLNAIKKDGYKWDADKKELVKKEIELVDGEIYYAKTKYAEWIYIYKKNYTYETNHYAAVLNYYLFEFNDVCTTRNDEIKILRKATEEEKRMLFKIIEENGQKWDADKKVLVRIDKKFDVLTLQPFDKVLIRDNDAQSWRCDFFNSYQKFSVFPFVTVRGISKQCVPYNDETKHLVTTNELPPEKYITWKK